MISTIHNTTTNHKQGEGGPHFRERDCRKTVRLPSSTLPILFLAMILLPAVIGASPQDASNAINQADSASYNAFLALREAQLAGANVTEVGKEFNEGIINLQAAKNAEAQGDYDSAVTLAQRARDIFTIIQTRAMNLKADVISENNLRSTYIILSSIASVAIVTIGFHLVERWRYRRWLKRLPEMRIRLKERKDEDT